MLDDQKELLCAFNARKIKYLVVGGHAVGLHAEPRGTKDLDVLIRSDPENAEAVFQALAGFGAPLDGTTPDDFVGHPDLVFQIGVPPARVDILQKIEGVEFDEAWERRVDTFLAKDVPAHVLSREDLIRNKLAVGRGQDLVDVEKIRAAAKVQES